MNNLVRLFLFLAILAVVCIAGFAACVVTHGSIGGFSLSLAGKAQRTEQHALALTSGGTLRVDVRCGAVRVRSSDVEDASVTATIKACAKDEEAAKELLGRTHLSLDDGTGEVRLVGATKDEERLHFGSYSTPTIDLEIVVPSSVKLDVTTGSGDIRAEGKGYADARLVSSYGAVSISGVRGNVEAKSSSGDVSVDDAKGSFCSLHSSYGAVSVTRVEADEILAETSSGNVKAADLKAARIALESGYGDIDMKQLDGLLVAKSASGSVRGRDLTGTTLQLASEYGAIRVDHARGALQARSSSGDVEVEGLKGGLVATSGYGAVNVAGVFTRLEAQSSSGSVVVRVANGSSMESDWSLSSEYGRVSIEVPGDFRCALDAKTGYGSLDVQFPMEIAAGALKSKDHVRGNLNGGGKLLTLRAASGNVSVIPLGK